MNFIKIHDAKRQIIKDLGADADAKGGVKREAISSEIGDTINAPSPQ